MSILQRNPLRYCMMFYVIIFWGRCLSMCVIVIKYFVVIPSISNQIVRAICLLFELHLNDLIFHHLTSITNRGNKTYSTESIPWICRWFPWIWKSFWIEEIFFWNFVFGIKFSFEERRGSISLSYQSYTLSRKWHNLKEKTFIHFLCKTIYVIPKKIALCICHFG